MFGTYGYSYLNFNQGSPAVQEVLGRAEFTLEDLLDEDGLTNELKILNQRLLDFILKEENFTKLIKYAVLEPDLESLEFDQKKIYKYPYICAEILATENQAIISELFKTKSDMTKKNLVKTSQGEVAEDLDEVNTGEDSPEKGNLSTASSDDPKDHGRMYLNLLFSILDTSPLNYTSAGYFTKIISNLFSKRPYFLLSYLYEENSDNLEKLVGQIASKSVAEFLAKVLTFESSYVVGMSNELLNVQKEKCLKLIIDRLKPSYDMEDINNAAFLICEVFGKYNTMHCSQETLQKILDKETILYFFELFKSKNATTVCAVGLILGNILAYYILINAPKVPNNGGYSYKITQIIEDPTNISPSVGPTSGFELSDDLPLVTVLVENIDFIVRYISTSEGVEIKNQFGAQIKPFGPSRLKLIELMMIALKTNNKTICDKIIESSLLETLLMLMTKYEWNNLVHNQVEKIINAILDQGNDSLKRALFEKGQLLKFLADAGNDQEQPLPGKHARKIRKGYLGQVVRISNKILDSKDPYINLACEKNEIWNEYVKGVLAETNTRNKINFGGRDPREPIPPPVEEPKEEPSSGPHFSDPDSKKEFMKKFHEMIRIKNNKGGTLSKKQIIQNHEEEQAKEAAAEQEEAEKRKKEEAEKQEDHSSSENNEFLDSPDKKKPKGSLGLLGKGSIKILHKENDSLPEHDEPVKDVNILAVPPRLEMIDEPEDDILWFSEPSSSSIEEESNRQVDDPEFYVNSFFKLSGAWHDVDDILKEVES